MSATTADRRAAALKLVVRGELHHTAAEGNGPVNAIDAALRKALTAAYPEIAAIRLDDDKVRILDGRARPPGRPPRMKRGDRDERHDRPAAG